MKSSKLIFAVFLLVSMTASAAHFNKKGEISRLAIWQGHSGILVIHQHMINPESCRRTDNYLLKSTHPFYKEFYALLLSAHMANHPVSLGVQGCHEGFPVIFHVYSNK